MQPEQAGLEQLKEGLRATWMAGDFGQIAQYSRKAAEEFIARIGIKSGAKMLDIACGTGNLSIPAARRGAKVTGVDIATNLIEQARQRAAKEGVDVRFDEGDAEQLPYGDGEFDSIMTMFGAMFAPRPERVASEMVRVCRSGGTIVMANWTQRGFTGKVFAAGVRFVPPPEGVPSPLLWGDPDTVKKRLANGTSEVRTTFRNVDIEFPFPPAEVVQFFRNYFGPIQVAFSKLDPQKQGEYAAELERLWRDENQATGDRTLVRAEYLEVLATRA
jgi:ubiquinone/menaquinone biosynthesis C-methylase UbiE